MSFLAVGEADVGFGIRDFLSLSPSRKISPLGSPRVSDDVFFSIFCKHRLFCSDHAMCENPADLSKEPVSELERLLR